VVVKGNACGVDDAAGKIAVVIACALEMFGGWETS
jgi:hypothetical protein